MVVYTGPAQDQIQHSNMREWGAYDSNWGATHNW